ncbi:alpha/beta hydrolase [Photobacterium makurazakiensis]|uniref:alpha/beta hydrolase n=1 Tax=Photobacterium makurazakiensis TaxID=2910234 RepID=UPI003D1485FB
MFFDPSTKSYDASRMVTIADMQIPQLNRQRTVRIYLPVDYFTSEKSYPVLYMQDGQNVFEPELCIAGASWQAAEHLDDFQEKGKTEGIIVVAVDCSKARGNLGRRDEYSPWPFSPIDELSDWHEASLTQGGEGKAYCDFLVNTLKPYIDAHYRSMPAREHTTIAGSSMGGFISLYSILQYQDTFSKAGIFSPAFWFSAKPMKAFIHNKKINQPIDIYMDIGTHETSDASNPAFPSLYHSLALDVANQLSAKSKQLHCEFHIDKGGIHSEYAWASRFPAMIEQFYVK